MAGVGSRVGESSSVTPTVVCKLCISSPYSRVLFFLSFFVCLRLCVYVPRQDVFGWQVHSIYEKEHDDERV